jgi:hypothetical protein
MGGKVRAILERFGAEARGATDDGERFAFDGAPLGLTAIGGKPLKGEVVAVLYSEEALGFESPAELAAAGILWVPHVQKPSELRTAVKDAHDRIKKRIQQDEKTLERLGFRPRMSKRRAVMMGYGEVLGSDVIVELEPPAILMLVEADDETLPESERKVVEDAEEVGATRAHELIGERLEQLRADGVLEDKDDFDIATVRAPLPTIPSAARVSAPARRDDTSELEIEESGEASVERPGLDISIEEDEDETGLMAAPDSALVPPEDDGAGPFDESSYEYDDEPTQVGVEAPSEATEIGVAPPSKDGDLSIEESASDEAPALDDPDAFEDETNLVPALGDEEDETRIVSSPGSSSSSSSDEGGEVVDPAHRPPTVVEPNVSSSGDDAPDEPVPDDDPDATRVHAELPSLAGDSSEEAPAPTRVLDEGVEEDEDEWMEERTAALSRPPFSEGAGGSSSSDEAAEEDDVSVDALQAALDGELDSDEGEPEESEEEEARSAEAAIDALGEPDDDDGEIASVEDAAAVSAEDAIDALGDGFDAQSAEEAIDALGDAAPREDAEDAIDALGEEPRGFDAESAAAAIEALGDDDDGVPPADEADADAPTRPTEDLDPMSLAEVAAAAAAGALLDFDVDDDEPFSEPTGPTDAPTETAAAEAPPSGMGFEDPLGDRPTDPEVGETLRHEEEAKDADEPAPAPEPEQAGEDEPEGPTLDPPVEVSYPGLAEIVGEGISTGKTGAIVLDADAFQMLQQNAARDDALEEAHALEKEAEELEARALELRDQAKFLRQRVSQHEAPSHERSLAAEMSERRATRDEPEVDAMESQPTLAIDTSPAPRGFEEPPPTGVEPPATPPTAGDSPSVAPATVASPPSVEASSMESEIPDIASQVEPGPVKSSSDGVALQDVEAFLNDLDGAEGRAPPIEEPTQVLAQEEVDVFGDAGGGASIPAPPSDDDDFEATQVAAVMPDSEDEPPAAEPPPPEPPAVPQLTRVALVVNDGRARERLRKYLDPLLDEIIEFANVNELLRDPTKETLAAAVLVRPPRDASTLQGIRDVGRAGPRTLVISSDDAFDSIGVDQRLPLGRRASEVAQSVLDGLTAIGVPLNA